MQIKQSGFDEQKAIKKIKHYLPSQSPLKDFIHHNTLHAFDQLPFHKALQSASIRFGYKVYLQLEEYRHLYKEGKISEKAISHALENTGKLYGISRSNILNGSYTYPEQSLIGSLRAQMKDVHKFNPDKKTHPLLFRIINSYLDQGVSINGFPMLHKGFLNSLREIEKNSFSSLFSTERARLLFMDPAKSITDLLDILVDDSDLYEQYLFDQQFAHPGWSGMVAVIESNQNMLLDKREITLSEFIQFELLLEIDAFDAHFGTEAWLPLSKKIRFPAPSLTGETDIPELFNVLAVWQEAYEWSYYYEVISGIAANLKRIKPQVNSAFHALFCIDDRECSLRRHLEQLDERAMTYGTPGYFNVEFYFRPEHSRFSTKVCPAPLAPKHLITETENTLKRKKATHFTKHSHSLLSGWLIAQTLGIWSAFKLFINIFKPSVGPSTSYAFRHMDKNARLNIDYDAQSQNAEALQAGFTVAEMADRMEGLLRGIGLIDINTPFVYFVAHGASSVNNTHYAGYDCGACSGRPGSVNARVAAFMCMKKEVRDILRERGIHISENTRFIGALHDTTRDEIEFFDTDSLTTQQSEEHRKNTSTFEQALTLNAKERSRRFLLTNSGQAPQRLHQKVKLRSVSLFEPRPELNHAGNAICIVGSRLLSKGLFLDRRAFLNSYDYKIDPDGSYLANIMNALAPVCGGINLEYYFSRTDNQKLGAGSKLPHNVMGLVGVANGSDGDLRTGLPLQMIEIHDPRRLLMIVEASPDFVLQVIKRSEQTYNWFINDWIRLIVLDPASHTFVHFSDGVFARLEEDTGPTVFSNDIMTLLERHTENLPVILIEESAV